MGVIDQHVNCCCREAFTRPMFASHALRHKTTRKCTLNHTFSSIFTHLLFINTKVVIQRGLLDVIIALRLEMRLIYLTKPYLRGRLYDSQSAGGGMLCFITGHTAIQFPHTTSPPIVLSVTAVLFTLSAHRDINNPRYT